jgi:hypothetical protein
VQHGDGREHEPEADRDEPVVQSTGPGAIRRQDRDVRERGEDGPGSGFARVERFVAYGFFFSPFSSYS